MIKFLQNMWEQIKEIRIDPRFTMILILAIITEVPRWAVAFLAIHEPLWIGIPIGILLSYATAYSWKVYFESQQKSWTLFGISVFSLLCAVAIITPVIFAMTEMEIRDIELSKVLGPWARMVWSLLLATITFVPLIQFAVAYAEELKLSVPQQFHRDEENDKYRINQVDEENDEKNIVKNLLQNGTPVKKIAEQVSLSTSSIYKIKNSLNGAG